MSEETIFQYVVEQLELSPSSEESEQDFYNRVVVAISALDEASWEALPEDLQNWYNASADLIATDEDTNEDGMSVELPEMVGYTAPEASSEPEKSAVVMRAPKPKVAIAKPQKEKKEKKAKAPKEPKEPKAPKEPKEPKGPVAAEAVREILCNNMELTLDQVMEALTKRGVAMQRSSCQVVFLNTVRAFQMIVATGYVKNGEDTILIKTVE